MFLSLAGCADGGSGRKDAVERAPFESRLRTGFFGVWRSGRASSSPRPPSGPCAVWMPPAAVHMVYGSPHTARTVHEMSETTVARRRPPPLSHRVWVIPGGRMTNAMTGSVHARPRPSDLPAHARCSFRGTRHSPSIAFVAPKGGVAVHTAAAGLVVRTKTSSEVESPSSVPMSDVRVCAVTSLPRRHPPTFVFPPGWLAIGDSAWRLDQSRDRRAREGISDKAGPGGVRRGLCIAPSRPGNTK